MSAGRPRLTIDRDKALEMWAARVDTDEIVRTVGFRDAQQLRDFIRRCRDVHGDARAIQRNDAMGRRDTWQDAGPAVRLLAPEFGIEACRAKPITLARVRCLEDAA